MNKKIKVLEVLDCYYPKFDGPTLVITSYCKSFTKGEDIYPEAVVPFFPKYQDNQVFKVNRVKSMPTKEGYRMGIPAFDCKLKKYLKENHFDLIHIHSPFTMCKFFAKYGKKNHIPTLFTFHTKYKEDFERMLKTKFLQNFMMKYMMKNINSVDKVLTVSDGAKACLQEYGYKKDIKVIRNGTDLIYPNNPQELVAKVNFLYNLKEDETVFLSVGRIVENKKLSNALNALKIVSDKGYNFKYLIVGAGPYANELKELVKKLGLTDNVIFTGKIMDRELLSAHYLRANLFLFPSTFDTASLSPIEAAAMKLPTLMTKGCCTAEIINDGVNGILREEKEEAWAEGIISFIEDKNLQQKLSENCYKEVYRTWDSVADEVKEYYKEVIKNFKGE